MKLATLIIIVCCLIGCGKKSVSVTSEKLYQVNDVEAFIENDSIIFIYHDNSWIYDTMYNQLKSNVLVYLNRNVIDNIGFCHTHSIQKDRDFSFSYTYRPGDITLLENKYQSHPLLYDFAYHIVSEFDLTEWQAFRVAVFEIDRAYKDDFAATPFELLGKYVTASDDTLKDSKAYQRLAMIREMISEVGIQNAWTDKPISPDTFLIKYDYFFTKRNINP